MRLLDGEWGDALADGAKAVTAAIITLAISLAAAIAGIIVLAVRNSRLGDELVLAAAELVVEQRRGDRLQNERDRLVADNAVLDADNAELTRRLAAAELARNAARKDKADAAAHEVSTAPTAAAAVDAFNRVLQEDQLPVSGETDPAGADRQRDGGAAAMQPAGGADAALPALRSEP